MKKIIISFLVLVVALFTTLEVQAAEGYTVYDDVSRFTSLTPLELGTKANIIKGISNIEDIKKTKLYDTYVAPNDCGLKGNVTVRNNYRYGEEIVIFKSVVSYENGDLSHISISAGEELIYDLTISTVNGDITVNVCKEYHPIDIFKRVETNAYLDNNIEVSYNFDGTENPGATDDFKEVDLSKISFTLLRGSVIKHNSVYEGKDVHMAVEMDHAMPIDELLKNISIKDDTEGVINDYMILSTTYKPVDGKIAAGVYSLRILAKDSKGLAVIQDISINAIDATAPRFTVEDIYTDYDATVYQEVIKSKLEIYDANSTHVQVTVDLSAYNPHKTELGDYPYSVTATDEFGNSVTKSAVIHVLDRKAPIIGVKDLTVTYPYALLSDDEIKAALTITDGFDGTIDKSKVKLTDVDQYRNNHDKLGAYKIEAAVSDSSGNQAKAIINILVVDQDYPEITIGSTIVVAHGEVLTRDKIIALLKQMGEIPADATEVVLSSLYFDEENPSGKYELRVTLPDGRSFVDTIAVNEENNSYDGPAITKPGGVNVPLAVGLSLSSAAIVAASTLFILVYKRKH